MDKAFDQKKTAILKQISGTDEDHPDASPKGTIDVAVVPLIDLINEHSDMVTTSSCSGRVSVFLEGTKAKAGTAKLGGKGNGGKWLFISHEPENLRSDWWSSVKGHTEAEDEDDDVDLSTRRYVLFKFETVILHVKCRNRDSAASLYSAAMACGFRESGMGPNDLVGIRNSMGLDVPVAYLENGKIVPLVPDSYISHLTAIAVDLFKKNARKINELHDAVKGLSTDVKKVESVEERRQRKRLEGLRLQAEKRAQAAQNGDHEVRPDMQLES